MVGIVRGCLGRCGSQVKVRRTKAKRGKTRLVLVAQDYERSNWG